MNAPGKSSRMVSLAVGVVLALLSTACTIGASEKLSRSELRVLIDQTFIEGQLLTDVQHALDQINSEDVVETHAVDGVMVQPSRCYWVSFERIFLNRSEDRIYCVGEDETITYTVLVLNFY